VPKVVGLRLATARKRIRRARCSVGRVRRVRSTRRNRVLAQFPRAGTRGPRGTRVRLVVGRRLPDR
jgi:beta-lactam-binding protein with PASTA domain